MDNYTVYMHICPNGKKYIGITKQEVNKRWLSGWGYHTNVHFWRAIKKWGWDTISHEILYEELSRDDAIKKEIELIAKYNTTNPDAGYNVSPGGDGSESISKETREKIRDAQLGKKAWAYGRSHSEASKKKDRRSTQRKNRIKRDPNENIVKP